MTYNVALSNYDGILKERHQQIIYCINGIQSDILVFQENKSLKPPRARYVHYNLGLQRL